MESCGSCKAGAAWVLASCLLLPHVVLGQGFPSRPLQLVVPSAPGAAYDLIARVIVDGAREGLGSIVVDNRPGGNFTIGTAHAKRSAPDGHTLLLGGSGLVIGEAMNLPRPYKFLEDFDPVGQLTELPFYLVVQTDTVPVSSLRELIAFAKARPGKLVYVTPGNGGPHHFAMESLKIAAGLDILHVPYKAMAQAMGDMLAGRVNLTITGYPAIAPHMATGKFRILAIVGRGVPSFNPRCRPSPRPVSLAWNWSAGSASWCPAGHRSPSSPD